MPETSSAGRRRTAFIVLLIACTLVAAASIAVAVLGGDDTAGVRDDPDAPRVKAGLTDAIVFRSLDRSRPSEYGRIAWTPVGAPEERRRAGLACARVHVAGGRGLCLSSQNPLAPLRVRILGSDLRVRGELELNGTPSRARVSPDGRYGTVTAFVSGHSYAEAGQFSTQTTLIDMSDASVIADVEKFRITRDGSTFRAVDFNFWGVTFAAGTDTFFATLGTGGRDVPGARRHQRAIRDGAAAERGVPVAVA